jgi:uroporphyrinogen decarboxylase
VVFRCHAILPADLSFPVTVSKRLGRPMNTKLLNALNGSNYNSPPVWLMRQAGRYLPEYRAIRTKYSFLEMCHQPELISEITLQPLRRFGMDAAILFSDILVILEALGVGLRFDEGIGPVIERPVRSKAELNRLPTISVREKLSYVADGIRMLIPQLSVPLLGFAGAPFTVASYLIEGGSSKELKLTKQWMYSDPVSFQSLLNLIADYTADYLNMQVESGVCAVQIFDSWAHVLSKGDFNQFALPAIQRIMIQLHPNTKTILFCRGSAYFAPDLASLQPTAVSLDWMCDLAEMRQKLGPKIVLQGNIDPCILYAPVDVIRARVTRLLESMEGDSAWIFNLGHGISPDMPIESVATLVDTVQAFEFGKDSVAWHSDAVVERR